jgi:hypothetical protein
MMRLCTAVCAILILAAATTAGAQFVPQAAMPMQPGHVVETMPTGAPMPIAPPGTMMEPMPGMEQAAAAGYRPQPMARASVHGGPGMPPPMPMGPGGKVSKGKASKMCRPDQMGQQMVMGPPPCAPPMCLPTIYAFPLTWY